MKKWLLAVIAVILAAGFSGVAFAQDFGSGVGDGSTDGAVSDEGDLQPWEAHPEDYELVDSVRYVRMQVLDSSLVGGDIFDILSRKEGRGGVRLNQSDEIRSVMESHFESNAGRKLLGYRVRIFFDNKQSARADSEAAMARFRSLYPEIEVFRSYVNPYFKVTVGNFRTRSEAMGLFRKVIREFPTAFIVREEIEYPPIESGKDMYVDTVSFYRYIGAADEVADGVNF